jgi:hypothetical protein
MEEKAFYNFRFSLQLRLEHLLVCDHKYNEMILWQLNKYILM